MNNRKKRLYITDGGAIIEIGLAGENGFRTVELDVSGWAEDSADYGIIYSRPDGTTYPVSFEKHGNILSWTPSAYDLEVCGFGRLEVRAYIGDIIGKSETFKVKIAESIQTDETEPGNSRPDWVNDIIDKVVIKSVEQTVTSETDGGENVFTVTLTDGSTADFKVKNGTKGSAGDAGYTPIRGTDYWTESDKEEFKAYVEDELDVLYRTVDPHIANEENPHGVTAEQVGTYPKGEIDVFVSDLGDVAARVSELETKLGDIDTALDELHTYAQSLIGGAK